MLELFKARLGKGRIIKSFGESLPKPTRIFCVDIETSGHNKLPGDSPLYSNHGIAGVSICNMLGESAYFVVNDRRDYGGIPIDEFMRYLDAQWMAQASVVALHNGKFDLGFLFARGMLKRPFYSGRIKIYDTWVASTIRNRGVYTSNKLKDLMRNKFQIDTSTEAAKNKWMEENGTKDFGDVPIEIMGSYAADDAVYTMILMLCQPPLLAEEFQAHDLYVRNCLHLIEAELTGVHVNVETMKQCMAKIDVEISRWGEKLKSLLTGVELNIGDDQALMKYLHIKNLYCGPRERFGETKYVFDPEVLCMALDHPLVEAFYQFQRSVYFKQCFSGQAGGEMVTRLFRNGEHAGYYPNHFPSMHAKGGLPQCKKPDVTDRVALQEVSHLFAPRPGKRFVSVQICDVPALLLGYYAQDAELRGAAVKSSEDVLTLLERRTNLKSQALPVLLRQIVEGSGNALLEKRLKARRVPVGNRQHFEMADKFKAALPKFDELKTRLAETLAGQGCIRDIYGRTIVIPEDKRWRTLAILIQASAGEVVSVYFDLLCRLAEKTGARLLLAHETQFLFEVAADSGEFLSAVESLAVKNVLPVRPLLRVAAGAVWECYVDAHLR